MAKKISRDEFMAASYVELEALSGIDYQRWYCWISKGQLISEKSLNRAGEALRMPGWEVLWWIVERRKRYRKSCKLRRKAEGVRSLRDVLGVGKSG